MPHSSSNETMRAALADYLNVPKPVHLGSKNYCCIVKIELVLYVDLLAGQAHCCIVKIGLVLYVDLLAGQARLDNTDP